MAWHILRRVAVRDGSRGSVTRVDWQPEPGFPNFVSAAAARRALMCALDPALLGASDEHIQRHWAQQVRNVRHHKITWAKS